MYAFWAFTLFSALIVMTSAATAPVEIQRIAQAKAETRADNFLGYRRAVLDFREANPGYNGSATASQLAAYAYWGDTFEAGLGNLISGGRVYVWQAPPFLPGEAQALSNKLHGSYSVGIKRGGTLWTQRGQFVTNTGITLPASIPEGALVTVD